MHQFSKSLKRRQFCKDTMVRDKINKIMDISIVICVLIITIVFVIYMTRATSESNVQTETSKSINNPILQTENQKSVDVIEKSNNQTEVLVNNDTLQSKIQNESQKSTDTIDNIYDLGELSSHNSAKDCLMIVDKNVYNLSQYIKLGVHKDITNRCGKDVTNIFYGIHSGNAKRILDRYKIGILK